MRSGEVVVSGRGLRKCYGEKLVLEELNIDIMRGEKVAFVGKNGEGKSTLVKMIMNEIPYEGSLKIGHNVNIGYFAQNQADLMDTRLTVLDTIDRVAVGEIRKKIRDILGAFLFSGEDVDKKVEVLSGGERTRLAMVRLLLEPYNLLILDEPTNHLDLRTKDILKEALRNFEGTVIVVSHDRDFLNGLADKVFEFANHGIKEYLGGVNDFLEAKKVACFSEYEKWKKRNQVALPKETEAKEETESRMSFEERKQWNREIKKAEQQIERWEKEIAGWEEKIAEMESRMAEGQTGEQLYKDYDEARKTLDRCMEEWEQAQEKLESIKQSGN